MEVEYPIIISGTPFMIYEFQNSEYSAHEDDMRAGLDVVTVWTILNRHNNKIEIRDVAELGDIYRALKSGTFTGSDIDEDFQKRAVKQAQRWIAKLRYALDAEGIR